MLPIDIHTRRPIVIVNPLTQREREVTALVAQGLRNQQIATCLVVAERTVEVHVSHALAKLELTSRAQLAVWAVQHGVVEPARTA